MKKTAIYGFTLVELLITVVIGGILIGVATPSFVEMTVRNRVATSTNQFMSALNLARSEAVRRGTAVSLCISTDGTSCAVSGSWSDGWIIFVNTDNDNPAAVDAGESLVKEFGAFASTYTLTSADFPTHITFASNGSAQSAGVLAVCHGGDPVDGRAILITRLRPRVGTDTDGDGIPNKDDGSNIGTCANP